MSHQRKIHEKEVLRDNAGISECLLSKEQGQLCLRIFVKQLQADLLVLQYHKASFPPSLEIVQGNKDNISL